MIELTPLEVQNEENSELVDSLANFMLVSKMQSANIYLFFFSLLSKEGSDKKISCYTLWIRS